MFVRHGEVARGMPVDPPLSERGVAQARAVAEFLAGEPHDALYVSPLARARQTAEAIGAATGLVPAVEDGLAEFDRDHPYAHFEDLMAVRDPRVEEFLRGDLSGWGTDVESFRATVLTAVDGIVARHRGQRVILVTHGGVANVFFGAVLGLKKLGFHAPEYASISRARAGAGRRTLVSLNETGHLRNLNVEAGEQVADRSARTCRQ
jgi:broad specificity phosphatase PhoE